MPLQLIRQDITKMECDAIVNTSNEFLLPGGGVDTAIHEAAGIELDEACRKIGYCETGKAVITEGYNLHCKYIIHTSGPIWFDGNSGEEETLRSCYRECLKLAVKYKCESVAFPLISSGVYDYPKKYALKVAMDVISEFLFSYDMLVYIVLFDDEAFIIGGKLFSNTPDLIGNQKAADYINNTLQEKSVDEYVKKNLDYSFIDKLQDFCEEKGMTEVECYKSANVSRGTYHKIKNQPGYRPGKNTVLCFAISLKLNLDETNTLLNTMGYSLSHSDKSDLIVEFYIKAGKYDINDINIMLFDYNLPTLCSFE